MRSSLPHPAANPETPSCRRHCFTSSRLPQAPAASTEWHRTQQSPRHQSLKAYSACISTQARSEALSSEGQTGVGPPASKGFIVRSQCDTVTLFPTTLRRSFSSLSSNATANIREILKALCPQLAHRYESEKYNNELDDAIHDLLGSHSDWAVSSDELIMSIADGFPMIVGLLHEGQTDGHACLVIGVTFRQLDPNEQRRFSSHRRRLIDRHAPRYGAQAFLPMWGIAEVTIWDPAHASTRRLFGSDFSAQTAFLLGLNEACQLMELELDSRARSRERAKLLPKSSARPQQIEGLRIEMKPTNRR